MRTPLARTAMPLAVVFAVLGQVGTAPLAGQAAHGLITRDSLTRALAALSGDRGDYDRIALPSPEQFSFGDRTIAVGSTVAGPVGVAGGTLHVRGVVNGDAAAYGGDVVVHEGGTVRGNATAVAGTVVFDGGTIVGDARSLTGDLTPVAAAAQTPRRTVMQSLALASGWLGVLLIVGTGVLVFSSRNLDTIGDTIDQDFAGALVAGIGAQIALLPVLALLIAGLALTVVGLLLIPFAIVAYVLLAAGLLTLGYLAMARIVGRSVLAAESASESGRRAASLTWMVAGLVLLMSPWLLAAGLAWSPMAGLVIRLLALAVTWVAATTGLGAAVISRGGVRRIATARLQHAMGAASWQTPTPVSGVVAGRRATSATPTART